MICLSGAAGQAPQDSGLTRHLPNSAYGKKPREAEKGHKQKREDAGLRVNHRQEKFINILLCWSF